MPFETASSFLLLPLVRGFAVSQAKYNIITQEVPHLMKSAALLKSIF